MGIGNRETRTDSLTPALAARFAATLDRDVRGELAPQGIHWCLCTPDAATGDLGPDGHPAGGGGFLPKSPLPRRMWASSELVFHAPLRIGAAIERRSLATAATEKNGSTGPLLFVTVEHVTLADDTIAVEEKQTIVYRAPDSAAAPPTRKADQADWHWRRELGPNQLSRFAFRGVSPAFASEPLVLLARKDGDALTLAAQNADGATVMTATASTV